MDDIKAMEWNDIAKYLEERGYEELNKYLEQRGLLYEVSSNEIPAQSIDYSNKIIKYDHFKIVNNRFKVISELL